MAQRIGHIEQVRGEFPYTITGDVGGTLGQPPPATPLENSLFIAGSMKRGGYNFANVGDTEAKLGVKFLRERTKETGVPYVSANLVRAGTRKPVLPAYVVLQVGGLRVGVLGLLDPPVPMPDEITQAGLEVGDPVATAREMVPAVRRKCDLVLVAAYMSSSRAKGLLEQVPGIDVMLCRNSRDLSQPEQVGSTVLAGASNRNQGIAELEMQFAETGKIASSSGSIAALQETGPADREMLAAIKELLDRQTRERLARVQAQRSEPPAQAAAPAAPPPAPTGAVFVGSAACQSCHAAIYDRWSGQPHATAFARLAATEDWNKADCLRCHVTGYGSVPGSREGLPAPEFWNVQCEACHGPASLHVAQPGKMTRVEAATCQVCHTEQWSPDFDYQAYWARADHGR